MMNQEIQNVIRKTHREFGNRLPSADWISRNYNISLDDAKLELDYYKDVINKGVNHEVQSKNNTEAFSANTEKKEDVIIKEKEADNADGSSSNLRAGRNYKYSEEKPGRTKLGGSISGQFGLVQGKDERRHLIGSGVIRWLSLIVAVAAVIRNSESLFSYFFTSNGVIMPLLSAITISGLSIILPQTVIKSFLKKKPGFIVLGIMLIVCYIPVATVSVLATSANLFDNKSKALSEVSESEKNSKTIERLEKEIAQYNLDKVNDQKEKDQLSALLPKDVGSKEYNRIRNNIAVIQGRIDKSNGFIIEKQKEIKELDSAVVAVREQGIGENERLINVTFSIVLELAGAVLLAIGIFV